MGDPPAGHAAQPRTPRMWRRSCCWWLGSGCSSRRIG